MGRITAILLVAGLSAAAAPALAAWDKVGSINFEAGDTRESKMGNFNGNVMGLTARDSDVMCDRVTAFFSDGGSRRVFRGELPEGVGVRIDLPPRSVDRVDFNCRPKEGGRATVEIAADAREPSNSERPKG